MAFLNKDTTDLQYQWYIYCKKVVYIIYNKHNTLSNHLCVNEVNTAHNSTILRIHVTSPILGERISDITLTQQRKQWLSVELNRWRSERIYCYF